MPKVIVTQPASVFTSKCIYLTPKKEIEDALHKVKNAGKMKAGGNGGMKGDNVGRV